MRITVVHNRDIDDARRNVERAVEKLATINLPGAVEISRVDKRWSGATLEFSLYAAVGPFRSPIRGWAIVTEKDVTVDIDLPKLLTAVVPERAFETSVRGLLGG
jgi:hypothetical protein